MQYRKYAYFLLHTRQLFPALQHSEDFLDYNTHTPMLPKYRQMLETLKTYGRSLTQLSKTQINELLSIAPFSLVEK